MIVGFARALGACLLLAGCAVGPDYKRPVMTVPTKWRDAPAVEASGHARTLLLAPFLPTVVGTDTYTDQLR